MRIVRSVARASVLAAALTMTLVASAFAHECYNASASAQGNAAKGTHSQAWTVAVDVRQLIATGSSGFLSGFPTLDACQQTAFLSSYATSGLPLVFTTAIKAAQGQDGVIAGSNPNMATNLGGNARGIDHFGVTGGAIEAALNAGYGAAFGASCP